MKKRIIAIALLIVCLFVTGCNKDGDLPHTPERRNDEVTYEGSHNMSYEFLEDDFISDGHSDYVLVYSANAKSYDLTAVKEFNSIFEKATGFTLNTTTDSGLSHTAGGKYISIGKTALFESSGLTVNFDELGNEGVRILTKDKTVYILGGKTNGVIFGVYDFMSIAFNYETFYEDCIQINEGVNNLKLINFNVTDIPDIALRARNYSVYSRKSEDYDMNMFKTRMRMTSNRELLPIHKTYSQSSPSSISDSHNSTFFLPREVYYADHQEWFSDNGDQLCYTAHGDAEEFEAMASECAKKVEYSLTLYTPDEHPEYDVVALNIMDNRAICSCKACAASFKTYDNCNSAAAIKLINRMAELVDEWMEKPENAAYKREMHYIFFAYLDLEPCPARYNEETKKYEPIDETVKMRDNVGVYLALLDQLDYQASIYDAVNDDGRKIIDAWGDMTDYVWYWLYEINFRNANYFYDSFNFFGEAYSYICNKGATLLYTQGKSYEIACDTVYDKLKLYLNSKLSWDSSLDVSVLTDNWFNAMFKEAAPAMKRIFLDTRAYNAKMIRDNGFIHKRTNYNEVNNAKYWSLNYLKQQMAAYDEAKQIIATVYAEDSVTKTRISRYIEAEWFSPAFITAQLYAANLSTAEKSELYARVSAAVEDLGITRTGESAGTSVMDVLNNM